MARNAVQFRKGLSEPAFDRQYGTEEQCRAVVIAARWHDEFRCPACGGREHSVVATRGLFQCTACRRQTSPIAGTIFASAKPPLHTWFRAMCHLTQEQSFAFSEQAGHLQHRAGPSPGRDADDRVDGEAQAKTGHAGA